MYTHTDKNTYTYGLAYIHRKQTKKEKIMIKKKIPHMQPKNMNEAKT